MKEKICNVFVLYIYLAFIADCENIIKIHESDISLYGERIRLEQSAFLLSK